MKSPALSDLGRYRSLSDIRYSPSGRAYAFVVSAATKQNTYSSQLWLGGGEDRLACMAELAPGGLYAWEDDETLLFAPQRDKSDARHGEKGGKTTGFYRLGINGGEAVKAFDIEMAVDAICLLGKGSYLIRALYDTRGEAGAPADPGYHIIDELPFWANGRGYTNGLRKRLYRFDAQSGTLAPLSGAEEDVTLFCLSPCKRYVGYAAKAFAGQRSEFDTIWECDLETGGKGQRVPGRYRVKQMDYWGRKLVFAGADGTRYGYSENPNIYLLGGSQSEPAMLLALDATIGNPINSDMRLYETGACFNVHEDGLYFTSTAGCAYSLYHLPLEGGPLECISPEEGSLDCFAVSACGIRAVAFTGQRYQELYRVEGTRLERLSGFNDVLYAESWRGVPQHHRFTDGNGFDINGWVLLPRGFDPAQTYPAILNIHGGPKTAYGDIYYHEMQYWAGQGYFVLYCNPRGSDGAGNVFADIRGEYGGCDAENIMGFLERMLLAYPAIDSARLGVTGGSYGGFMTNWLIGHTNRFKAAASQRCISNWVSFAYTSDVGYSFGTDQMAADAWHAPEEMWRHSPLKYADKVEIPTLFIHSDEDYRCWLPECYQMYTALKLHGVESRICVFHGENHELSRAGKPENRMKRLDEITRWMNRYLKESVAGG